MAESNDSDYPGFQPLANYRGLSYGPGFNPTNQESQSLALDGTKQTLRDPRLGSPFTFRVRPPAILLNALEGKGGARTQSPFDPLLREVYEEALKNFQVVERRFADGLATLQELEDARQGMLGGRPSAANNINILETAQRANNNFSSVTEQRNQFGAKNFTASSATRGGSLTLEEDLVARNGQRFDPQKMEQSSANQTAVSDLDQAMGALVQLNKIMATPVLTLLVNPESLNITYAKKQVYTDRNRFNYIFQSWGEEQVRLSVSGRSAGFVVGAGGVPINYSEVGLGGVETRSVSGYQWASKWDSAAWQNLMGLFAFYRNNGYIYDVAGRPRSEAHLFIGSIEIAYDQWVYVGNFENFNYEYSEDKQHGAVNFSFEFVTSFMFDRAQKGTIQKYQSPTPSPSSAQGVTQVDPLMAEGANSTITQTIPEGSEGAPGTALLNDEIDPFEGSNPLQGPEIAPGVFLPPGSTTRFPTGRR